MARPLENAKIIKSLLKAGLKLNRIDSSKAMGGFFKKIVLKVEWERGPAPHTEALKNLSVRNEAGALDTLFSHKVYSGKNS